MLQVSSEQSVQLFSNCITSIYFSANWVKVIGTMCKPSNVVVLGIEDDFPKFGIVLGIFIVRGNRIVLHSYNQRACFNALKHG